jgi:ADP-ribose pyrophosphatase YjhB (NUDIX family)
VERRRRIAAYGVCRDEAGRVLLVRESARSTRPGTWTLPGGGVGHGEHPADAVTREVTEETGLRVRVGRPRDVAAELVAGPSFLEHTDGVVYDLSVTGGTLRPEAGDSTDLARWVPAAEAAALPLSRFAADALGLPPAPTEPVGPPPGPPPAERPGPRPRPYRGQRFAVYGVVTDPAGRLLLTLNAPGYPGAGRWHLPGGGTDFGEQPRDGLLREITEESGQYGRVAELLTVSHHHRAESGPVGHAVDWHAVRAVFRVAVADPTPPRVVDAGGSTAEAAWFSRAEAAALSLNDLATAVLDGGWS